MILIFLLILCFICIWGFGGIETALIVTPICIGLVIMQHYGVGRKKFNKETEDAIKRGEITVEEAYRRERVAGSTGYMSEEEYEAKQKAEEEEFYRQGRELVNDMRKEGLLY